MTDKFVHLHNHTGYSLLDGAVRIEELIQQALEYNMPAVAVTDHGVLYGMIDFYRKAQKKGIKPLIGCEVYLANNSRFEKKTRERYHLVLLAMNNKGLKNLITIVSKGWLEGFYYKPRVDKDLLYENRHGLTALSACVQGEIPRLLLDNKKEEAKNAAREYLHIFGKENFYLELQDHNLREEKQAAPQLIKLGKEMDIPLVISNDIHYLKKEDADLHDVLLALQTGKTINDDNRMTFPGSEFYFKSPEEMTSLFPDIRAAYQNTVKIAEASEINFDFDTFHLPAFQYDFEKKSREEFLKEKCEQGLKEKGLADDKKARKRLEYELSIIKKMGYISYFLIVWDFVDYARREGIRVGPGRGSAAGSLVSYLLGITRINPLEYDLIFERFLNPERVTMPDIDIDFDEQRDKIIDYVREKYGEEKVAQIGTFGTMAARGAIRDVGRALDIPLNKVDRIAKLVPGRPGTSLQEALDSVDKLKNYYRQDEESKKLLDYAQGVEGLPRHISTHAAGVIIGPEALINIIPLQTQEGDIITQLPMGDLEELGLLKMDFLGLRNLTIINKALEQIKERFGKKIDIDNILLDDQKVYKMLQEGKTPGVFQMESRLFQDLNQRLKPDRFTDLIALLALGRPGPLGSGLVDQYIESRHGRREPEYLHPSLEMILKETFGLILYQEQVMQIASELAGYTMGEADLLRRGMGKKKKQLIADEREKFVKGAAKNDIPADTAHEIFDQMEYFAGYGFNKSHSAAYALLAYQTAYLKANYPSEFMAALLSSVMSNLDKVAVYIRECRDMGIEVLPPDINYSSYDFKPGEKQKIHFGLKAIKNIGEGAIEAIVSGRKDEPYQGLKDFLYRVDLSSINAQVIEALIKSGAFSSFDRTRPQMLVKFEEIYEKALARQKYQTTGQTSFFDIVENEDDFYHENIKYPDLCELSLDERLKQEKEYLGIYLSGHPLDPFSEKISRFSNYQNFEEEKEFHGEGCCTLGGMIITKKEHITKRNNQMAFLSLESSLDKIDIVVFPDLYSEKRQMLEEGAKIFVKGRLDEEKIIAQDFISLDEKFMEIKINDYKTLKNKKKINKIKRCLRQHPGESPVFITLSFKQKTYIILIKNIYWIKESQDLIEKISDIVGTDNFKFY